MCGSPHTSHQADKLASSDFKHAQNVKTKSEKIHLLKLEPGRAENCPVFIGESPGRDESDDRLWLQAWRWQLLRPGACSRSWLAFRYVLIRPSRGHKHMQQVLSECTQRPKGQLCTPSVSKRIRISGGARSCLGSGASPWVIRRGCQGRLRWRGGGWEGGNFSYLCPPTALPCHRRWPKVTLTIRRKVAAALQSVANIKGSGPINSLLYVKVGLCDSEYVLLLLSHFYLFVYLYF